MEELKKSNLVKAVIGKDAYRTEIFIDDHHIIGDEPQDMGGQDLGPSPGDFLRMSLASCTAITLRMYANRKGFDISSIEVNVTSNQVEDKTIFECDIVITGNIDETQRKRMLQIANVCPVHKALTNPIEITTSIR